jgi:small subunit ribosomal protein S20
MANTKSAKKNIRSSKAKKEHNLSWKAQLKDSAKDLRDMLAAKTSTPEELNAKLKELQKRLDKASKEKAIHKNKANRLKSRYAKKISALLSGKQAKHTAKPAKSAKSK